MRKIDKDTIKVFYVLIIEFDFQLLLREKFGARHLECFNQRDEEDQKMRGGKGAKKNRSSFLH
jgi:hypothetical protein